MTQPTGRNTVCSSLAPDSRTRVMSTVGCELCGAKRYEPCYNQSKDRRPEPIKHLHYVRVYAYRALKA